MGAQVQVEGDAATALEELRKITARRDAGEVVADAFRTYEWVLEEQANGRTILSRAEGPGRVEEEHQLASLVEDQAAAKRYFSRR